MVKNKQTKQSFSDNQGGINIGTLFGIEGLIDDSGSTIGGLGKGPGNTAGVGGNVPITSLMPLVDPTYRSGFDYARSIAGGMPMSQVIAPGVSYSPEQPGGYTQADLNAMLGQTPPPPPPPPTGPTYKEGIEDMIRIPPSERGVTIPVDRKMPPLRDLFGGSPTQMPLPIPDYDIRDIDIDAIRQQIAESGIDFGNLLGIPKYEAPDLSQFVKREDMPSLIPDVPTGRGFSVDREQLIEDIRSGIDLPVYEKPDLSQFVRREDIPSLIPSVPTGKDFSIDRDALIRDIREGIEIPKYEMPDLSQFARLEDIPKIPSREDFLSIAREGIEIPQYQAPDLSGFARLEDIPTFDPNVLKQDILMSIPQQQVPDVSQFVTQEDIQKAIAGIDMPTYQAPDLSAYDLRLAELEQQLAGLQQPTGGRFSISQPAPRGLI